MFIAFHIRHFYGVSLIDSVISFIQNYFESYGYMGESNPDPKISSLSEEEGMKMAIMMFQQFGGLDQTGK